MILKKVKRFAIVSTITVIAVAVVMTAVSTLAINALIN